MPHTEPLTPMSDTTTAPTYPRTISERRPFPGELHANYPRPLELLPPKLADRFERASIKLHEADVLARLLRSHAYEEGMHAAGQFYGKDAPASKLDSYAQETLGYSSAQWLCDLVEDVRATVDALNI